MNLTWPILIGTALADSVNPVSFALLILLYRHHKLRQVSSASDHLIFFTIAAFITNFLAGTIFVPLMAVVTGISHSVIYLFGLICILIGLITTKPYFLPNTASTTLGSLWRLKQYRQHFTDSLAASFVIGVITTLIELPITGTTYLATLTLALINSFPGSPILVLTIYNLIYITPLVLLGLYLNYNLKTHRFQILYHQHRNPLVLGTGLLLISLGIWLLAS